MERSYRATCRTLHTTPRKDRDGSIGVTCRPRLPKGPQAPKCSVLIERVREPHGPAAALAAIGLIHPPNRIVAAALRDSVPRSGSRSGLRESVVAGGASTLSTDVRRPPALHGCGRLDRRRRRRRRRWAPGASIVSASSSRRCSIENARRTLALPRNQARRWSRRSRPFGAVNSPRA
jgi:hypothetical protein